MYKLESLNEHVDRLDTVDLLKNRDKCINAIVEALDDQLSREEVDQMMVSELFGLGRLLKGIFVNPFIKRKIDKMVDQLVKIRVQLIKTQLDENPEDLEDMLDDADEKASMKGYDAKIQALRDQQMGIEAKMELLPAGDERLERYVELQKIESRIKANEMTIKMADSKQAKILKKYNQEGTKEAKSIADELKESILNRIEKAQGNLNEARKQLKGETFSSRQMKITDLKSVQKDIDKLVKEYPDHDINVTDNYRWLHREDLRGTWTVSSYGPEDKGLSDKLDKIYKKGNKK